MGLFGKLRKTGNFHIEIISVFIYSLREGDLVRLLASFEKKKQDEMKNNLISFQTKFYISYTSNFKRLEL